MKERHSEDIIPLIERCAHFIHHRRGGNRTQGKILFILMREGEMTQKELQERLGIQAGSISEIVLKLQAKGFIERTKDEKDKRRFKLTITEKGKAHLNEKRKEHMEQEKSLFDALTPEEKVQLQTLLLKVHKSWERIVEDNHLMCHREDRQIERDKGNRKIEE